MFLLWQSSGDGTFKVQVSVGFVALCVLNRSRRKEVMQMGGGRVGGLQEGEEKKTLMCTYANEFGNVKLA